MGPQTPPNTRSRRMTDTNNHPNGLTQRQADIWQWYTAGASIRTIAYRLNLSPSTVRDHLHAATRRLHNTTTTEADQ